MRVERDDVPLVERRAREHDEPAQLQRLWLGDEPRGRGLLRAEDHRLLRQPQVASRRAHDAPDEEVEEDEEGDLEREECGLDLSRRDHQAVSLENAISVEPSVKRVPSSSFSRLTRLPRTSTPFVESRSISQ